MGQLRRPLRGVMTCSSNNVCRCRECGTLFEADVADRDPSGAPRCPQCFLSSWEPVADIDEKAVVIRTTTPFR
jgi:hypothetical protein